MVEIKTKSKFCPSCKVLTPPDLQIKRVSRSSGKNTASIRCKSCDDRSKKFKGA